jgi:acetylornithine deacetylase/succinyl-diaminopimelate desuccinylase-like protein
MESWLRTGALVLLVAGAVGAPLGAQSAPDWARIEQETLEHYQALLRLDTSNPPGNETRAADYLRGVLEREGISTQTFALDPARANLVARLPGSGARRPLLLMGHTDVVTVIPERWTHPPFGATRVDGHIYGRGAVDDKDNVTASLMVILMLKRLGVQLDRDVIFLAEAGEEGTTQWGIDFMIAEHWPTIEAEYCLAEGGSVRRENGRVRFASIQTLEKIPRSMVVTSNGPSGHGSVPLLGNAIARLGTALVAVSEWEPPIRLNETTNAYFTRMMGIYPEAETGPYRDVLSGNPERVRAAYDWFRENRPGDASIMATSISPTIISGGNRSNVIPSQVTATLDVRMLPDDDPQAIIGSLRDAIDDPEVTVEFASNRARPAGGTVVESEAFRAIETRVREHYATVAIPTMSTGATDMAQVRSMGVNCYGIGPALDAEDALRGFASHGDQERILEAELYRFLRFYWDVVNDIAARR